MKQRHFLLVLILSFIFNEIAWSQNLFDAQGNRLDANGNPIKKSAFADLGDSIKTEDIPTGLYTWTIDSDFGNIHKAEVDTMPHQFQNRNLTDGMTGQYNFLGNMGSPRLSRIFIDRSIRFSDFIFTDPLDFFYDKPSTFHYTNTLSPITNITYNTCGNKTNGEDRIKALFATNINKKAGFGFDLDYLYGRGYYNSQSTSFFDGTFYGSYIDDKYRLHLYYSSNHMKMAENGGIESDTYITNPESLPSKYGSEDIPTRLEKTWNRVYTNTFVLNHRYNLGFYRTTNKEGQTVKPLVIDSALVLSIVRDSLSRYTKVQDSLLQLKNDKEKDFQTKFIPVTSFNHAFQIDYNQRRYVSNKVPSNYYMETFYDGDSIKDRTRYLHLSNTFSIELNEGFNKWAKAGITLFFKHNLFHYKIPMDRRSFKSYSENEILLGGRIKKEQGEHLKYDLFGYSTIGKNIGEFYLDGNISVNLPFKKDTVSIIARGIINNEKPSFYFRHYHAQHAWWDNNNLNKELRSRVEGILTYSRTRTSLRIGLENIQNYTYFATTCSANKDDKTYSTGVKVAQNTGSIQIVSAILNQNFKWGILNWENEFAYQQSSNKKSLPLPTFSGYSNLYLLFKIAKVLRVQFGADARYFTSYYAPTYSPIIGQFATQADNNKVKVGDYPIVNAYVNFHLKHTRFYLMATHINKSSNGGKYFLVPHYPINPMVIRFGLSWNFFN